MKLSLRNTLLLGVAPGLFLGLSFFTFIYFKGCPYLTNNRAACGNDHVMRARNTMPG